jgi:hypothetical protein
VNAGERAVATAIADAAKTGQAWATATVTAVNGDGTLQLDFFGTVDNIHRLASYSAPTVGDVVYIIHGGGQILVLGQII